MDKEAFLKDLEAVFRKHGAFVTSCGCCNGTWVEKNKEESYAYYTDDNQEIETRDTIEYAMARLRHNPWCGF